MLHFFAKRLNELHNEDRKGEKGFTLIELLVVVIIIGILAAIAIPVFLSQRERANRAALESDVRNAAAAATSCSSAGTNNGSYENCDTVAALQQNGYNPTDDVSITDAMLTGTDSEFTLSGATHANLDGVTASFSTTGDDAGQVVVTEPEPPAAE